MLLDLRFFAAFFVACLAFTLALVFTGPAAQAHQHHPRNAAQGTLEEQSGGGAGTALDSGTAPAAPDPTVSQAPTQGASAPSAPAHEQQVAAPTQEPTPAPAQEQAAAPALQEQTPAPTYSGSAPAPGSTGPATPQAPTQGAYGASAPAQEPTATLPPTQVPSELIQGPATTPTRYQAPPVRQQAAQVQWRALESVAGQKTETGLAKAQAKAQEKAESTAAPVMRPVERITETAIDTSKRTVEPVRQMVEPAVATVTAKKAPMLDPTGNIVTKMEQPVSQQVEPSAMPVLGSIDNKTAQPVVDAVRRTPEPSVDEVEKTVGPVVGLIHRTVDPLTGPVREAVDPMAGTAIALLVSSPQAPVVSLREGEDRLVTEPVSAPGNAASRVDKSASEVPSRAPLPVSPDLPAAPAPAPAPANSLNGLGASSGLGVSSGGFMAFGILALLCASSPVGGRLLRSSCEFLRPSSALRSALENPG